MWRIKMFVTLGVLAIASGACNRSNPAAPSSSSSVAGVTIAGTVLAPVPPGLQVTIGGTSTASQVDGAGQFTLADAPAGALSLRFSGGASATLTLPNVVASQNIALVLTVSGNTATLESSRRVLGAAEEIEGRVESATPSSFVVAGRTVSMNGTTTITANGQNVQFDALAQGQRILTRGQVTGQTVVATTVEILTPVARGALNLNGPVSEFSGTRSAFQFSAGGAHFQGDAATTFEPGTQFNELGNGLQVQVTGDQRAGFVYATRIIVASPAARFVGRIVARIGSPPDLVLMLTDKTVMVSALTDVRRKGDPQDARVIADGQTVAVSGRLKHDGTVVASSVDVLIDAQGGPFLMTGTIGAITGSCPSIRLTISGYTIATVASTAFSGAACAGLAVGDKVEVGGVVQPDQSVSAISIKKI